LQIEFCRARVVVGVLAALGAASHAADAGELGVLAGSGKGYHSLALSYQTAPVWQGQVVDHPLEVSLEYSLGQVRAPTGQSNRDLLRLGVTPFARWWFSANSGIELGVGADVFSGTRAGDKDISTALQFGSSIGVLHRLRSTSWLIGVRLTHYSNAGIKQPNPGQDYLQLRASYVFP
jgi:lipid A 3-O-deacylase